MLNLPGLEKTYRLFLKRDAIGITAFPTVYAADEMGDNLPDRAAERTRKVRAKFYSGPYDAIIFKQD